MGCHPCKHKVLVNNENFLCYLCLQNYPEYIHYPCGHYGICEFCKNSLKERNNRYRNKCPVCNQKANIKKIFFQGPDENIRGPVVSYCMHLERQNNDKLENDNKILREISDLTKKENQLIKKKNKKLEKQNIYYKDLSQNNSKELQDIIFGYRNHMENLNLKKNLLNIKKMKMLLSQKEMKKINDNKNIYIIELIKKYQGRSIDLNDIDIYIEKELPKIKNSSITKSYYHSNNNDSKKKYFNDLEDLKSM